MDWRFEFVNPGGDGPPAGLGLLLVLLHDIDTLHNQPFFLWQHTNYFANFVFIICASAGHTDAITFAYLCFHHITPASIINRLLEPMTRFS